MSCVRYRGDWSIRVSGPGRVAPSTHWGAAAVYGDAPLHRRYELRRAAEDNRALVGPSFGAQPEGSRMSGKFAGAAVYRDGFNLTAVEGKA